MQSDYTLTKKEKELGFDEFETTIQAAAAGKIDYKKYHIVLDEDNNMTFLKRPPDEEREEDYRGENWPCNSYDGIELWTVDMSGGYEITEMFLKAFKIKYLG